MDEPVAELRFSGNVAVRPFRRGTYLAHDHLEALIERALGSRYKFGGGWSGYGVVSISLYERAPVPGAAGSNETRTAQAS